MWLSIAIDIEPERRMAFQRATNCTECTTPNIVLFLSISFNFICTALSSFFALYPRRPLTKTALSQLNDREARERECWTKRTRGKERFILLYFFWTMSLLNGFQHVLPPDWICKQKKAHKARKMKMKRIEGAKSLTNSCTILRTERKNNDETQYLHRKFKKKKP